VHRRIWNGSFDKHPAVIVRCAGVSDVIAAVKFGRASGLPVAVRSGGHSFPGLSVADDALMIDLSPMKGVRVDPEKRSVSEQIDTGGRPFALDVGKDSVWLTLLNEGVQRISYTR